MTRPSATVSIALALPIYRCDRLLRRGYFVSSATGNDANTGLSHAQALAKITTAVTKVADSAGDQILVAENTTYSDALTSMNGKRGFSTQYPTVIQSYDPANPTDETKYGRAASGNRPVITFVGEHVMGGGGGGFPTQPASLMVIRGLDFAPAGGAQGDLSWVPGEAVTNGNILIENCIFRLVNLGIQNDKTYGTGGIGKTVIIRNNTIIGPWGFSLSGLYFSSLDQVTLEDNLFYHNGWKPGASRDDSYTIGGVVGTIGRNHAFYLQEDCGSLCVRRNLIVDSAGDGGQTRASVLLSQNVYIDMPITQAVGSGARYDITKPFGVDLDSAYNFSIGDADADSSDLLRWGIDSANGRNGSVTRYNVLVRSNNVGGGNNNAFRTEALFNQPSYMEFRNNISYLRATSGATKSLSGTYSGTQAHPTYNNNIWDDPASGSNLNVSSYTPTNAYTDASRHDCIMDV
jgi:hypothetical protein